MSFYPYVPRNDCRMSNKSAGQAPNIIHDNFYGATAPSDSVWTQRKTFGVTQRKIYGATQRNTFGVTQRKTFGSTQRKRFDAAQRKTFGATQRKSFGTA